MSATLDKQKAVAQEYLTRAEAMESSCVVVNFERGTKFEVENIRAVTYSDFKGEQGLTKTDYLDGSPLSEEYHGHARRLRDNRLALEHGVLKFKTFRLGTFNKWYLALAG